MGFHNEIARHINWMGSTSEIDKLRNFAMELHAKSSAGSNPRGQVFVPLLRGRCSARPRATFWTSAIARLEAANS